MAEVHGLEKVEYVDKFDESKVKSHKTAINPCEYMDRVYVTAPSACEIHDPVLKRKLLISDEGSASTVVWNPGPELSKKRKDMEDDDYQHFVCVESANALTDGYTIEPGGIHQLKLNVSVVSLEEV